MDDVAATPRSLKHVAVREYVRSLVEGADAGAPAPSERELVQRFGVARMTVRQAMDALVSEGLLERMPGRGTFVARPRRMTSRLSSYTEEMTRRGLMAESQTLLARREQAGPGVARALIVCEGDAVIHWRRLRRSDGQPKCIEDAVAQRSWWAAQWPEGAQYVAGLVAQDVQDALLERVGRWPVCEDCGADAAQHLLYIQPDLGGPDPVWVCEESGDVVAPLGGL